MAGGAHLAAAPFPNINPIISQPTLEAAVKAAGVDAAKADAVINSPDALANRVGAASKPANDAGDKAPTKAAEKTPAKEAEKAKAADKAPAKTTDKAPAPTTAAASSSAASSAPSKTPVGGIKSVDWVTMSARLRSPVASEAIAGCNDVERLAGEGNRRRRRPLPYARAGLLLKHRAKW